MQIFFLQTARAHAIFFDFIIEVYWPKYSAGAATLSKSDAEQFIRRALDAGRMEKRWSESTVRRVSGYLLGCCTDFGLLGEGKRDRTSYQALFDPPLMSRCISFTISTSPGLSDMAVITHRDWRLFGLEVPDVIRLIQNLSHDGHLLIQSSADLVQISWKYRTMEDCLNALTER